ncbi:multidrug resistance-associated protein 5 [Tanacetum coccineum]
MCGNKGSGYALKHMTGNRKLFLSYKAYNGGDVIFGSNLCGNIIGKEPKNVNEALMDESWLIAIQEELNQFIANDVWELVPQPKNMTIIGTKWVFRNKLDENGIVSRNKARHLSFNYSFVCLEYANLPIVGIISKKADVDALGTVAEFLEEKCGCYFQGLYYQVPSQDFERGLVRVSDDMSTSYMFDVEETFGRLTLYLDHLDMNLSEYLSQAIQKEIGMAKGTTKVRSRSEGFTVDEGKRTCSCRMWQLSGLPCVHAIKVIFLINRVPESYVPAWFETDMYFVAYHNYVKPVPGMNFWPDQSMYSTVLPPKHRKMPGRLKKKRIRAIGEGGSSTRVSKVVEQTPKPKGVPGRPRKKQLVDDLEDVDVHRGPVREEGGSGTKGGAIGSRGRGGRRAGGSSGASGSIGRGAGGSGGASVSRGRGSSGSRGRGAGGSKRKMCQLLEHKKDKVRRRLGLLALLNGLDCKMNQNRLKMNQSRLKLKHNRLNMNLSRHKLKTKWSRLKIKLR